MHQDLCSGNRELQPAILGTPNVFITRHVTSFYSDVVAAAEVLVREREESRPKPNSPSPMWVLLHTHARFASLLDESTSTAREVVEYMLNDNIYPTNQGVAHASRRQHLGNFECLQIRVDGIRRRLQNEIDYACSPSS
jgi:hypothetical protein